jgi:hypothetical protein
MFSAFPLAAAGGAKQDYVSYVIISELSGSVVDAGTGAPIDNVVLEGEVHSVTLYVRVELGLTTYSYWIRNENGVLLKSGPDLSLVSGRFVLPLAKLVEPGEHTYRLTISAPGYESNVVEGKFIAGDPEIIRAALSRTSNGDFTITPSPNPGTITRNWVDGTVGGYNWVLADAEGRPTGGLPSSGVQLEWSTTNVTTRYRPEEDWHGIKVKDLQAGTTYSAGHQIDASKKSYQERVTAKTPAQITNYVTVYDYGWADTGEITTLVWWSGETKPSLPSGQWRLTGSGSTPSGGWYDTSDWYYSTSKPADGSDYRWVARSSDTRTLYRLQQLVDRGYWQDTGERYEEWWPSSAPSAPSGYRWVFDHSYWCWIWLKEVYRKERWVSNPQWEDTSTTSYEATSLPWPFNLWPFNLFFNLFYKWRVDRYETWTNYQKQTYVSRTRYWESYVKQVWTVTGSHLEPRYESAYDVTAERRVVTRYGIPYAVTEGRWRSEPLTVNVTLSSSGGFDNEVALSVDALNSRLPKGAQVILGDAKLRVRSSINTTLLVTLPDSGESLAGSYTIVVKAHGAGKQREARFTLKVLDDSLQRLINSLPESSPARTNGSISQRNYRGRLDLNDTVAYEVNASQAFSAFLLPSQTWSRQYSLGLKRWGGKAYVEVSAQQRGAEWSDIIHAIATGNLEGGGKLVLYSPNLTGTRFDSSTIQVAERYFGKEFVLVLREGSLERPFTPSSNHEYLSMRKVPIDGGANPKLWCSINPEDAAIRAFALNAAGEASSPEQAARDLLSYVALKTYYGAQITINKNVSGTIWCWEMGDGTAGCGSSSDGDIIWKAYGSSINCANLYVSLSNSLGVPARRVHEVRKKTNPPRFEGDSPHITIDHFEKAEINLNDSWSRCDPIEGTGLGTGSSIIIPPNITTIPSNVTFTTTVYVYDSNGVEHRLSS